MENKSNFFLVLALLLCFCQMQVRGLNMAPEDEFEVNEGILVAYHGAGGNVIIPDNLGIIEIAAYVFDGLTTITSVIIPDGVTKIGVAAFASCVNMSSITISKTVEIIDDWAFGRCSSLTAITIPASVESIGYWAFDHCARLSAIIVDAGNTEYADYEGVLFDKNQTILYRYPEGKSGSSYVIPNGVSIIDVAAFIYCKNLTSITIPNTVESIGYAAFQACASLASIVIPKSVTSIVGNNPFNECLLLSAIDVASDNEHYSSVDGIIYNKSRTTLYRCPEGKSAVSITLPGTVEHISNQAFSACSNLLSITLPNTVETIGERAFQQCTGITSITIPPSVLALEDYVFLGCSELTAIHVDSNNPSYMSDEGVLYDKNQMVLLCYPPKRDATVFLIPNRVTTLSAVSFADCRQLVSVIFPASVEYIGTEAFFYCDNLISIDIPSSVTFIGNNAFLYCNFDDITVHWNDPSFIATTPFHFWEERSYNLYVPAGTVGNYNMVYYWNNNNFIIVEQEPVTGISLDITSARIPLNHKVQLLPTITPRNATSKNVTWSSDNPSVATVTGFGMITAQSEGVATVTATTLEGGFEAECLVVVENGDFVVVNGVLTGYCGTGGIVNIPGSLGITEIGASVFEDNTTLTSVTIPEGVTKIAGKAFYQSSLHDINIPASMLTIAFDAFDACNSLTDINVDAYNPNYSSIHGVLYNIYRSIILVYPKAKGGSFQMPGSIQYIVERTFADCSDLEAIFIPNTVTTMGEAVFTGCGKLKDITVHWPSPLDVYESVFEGFDKSSCTLHVLDDEQVATRYNEHPVWKDFMSIIADVRSISVTGVGLNKSNVAMFVNDTDQLIVNVYPENATNKTVFWASNNPAVATVSTDGLVTAINLGKATISVATDDRNFSATCEVEVREQTGNSTTPSFAEKVTVFTVNGQICITSGASNPIKEVSVYNLQGVLMYRTTAIHVMSHNIHCNWSSGLYILKVISEKNTDFLKCLLQ